MKNIKYTLYVLVLLFNACKKEKTITSFTSINIVNAAVGTGTIKVNHYGKPINWAAYTGSLGNLNYGTSQVITLFNRNLTYPFIVVPAIDTLNAIFSQKLDLNYKGMYSLFIAGQTGAYDAVFVEEKSIPYNLKDSLTAVRFVNLSPNSPLVNITLASTPMVNEVSQLAYKQLTEFKQYPTLKMILAGSVTFQVRDASTNILLTSYTIPETPILPYSNVSVSLSRFKSITLVIKGLAGTMTGVNAYSIFPVAEYY